MGLSSTTNSQQPLTPLRQLQVAVLSNLQSFDKQATETMHTCLHQLSPSPEASEELDSLFESAIGLSQKRDKYSARTQGEQLSLRASQSFTQFKRIEMPRILSPLQKYGAHGRRLLPKLTFERRVRWGDVKGKLEGVRSNKKF